MKRQFLRVYLGIALVLLAAAFATLFVVDREVRKAIDQRLEAEMGSWLFRLRNRLGTAENPEQRARLLDRLNDFSPFAIRLIPLAELELSTDEFRRLAAGEVVIVHTSEGRLVYSAFDDDEVLALGPLQRRLLPLRRRERFGAPPLPLPQKLPPPPWQGESLPAEPPFFRRFPFQETYLLLGILLGILVLIGTAVYLLLRPFERRIYALADVARQFGEGRLEIRATTGGGDAIGTLANAFNQMASRIGDLIAQQRELLRAVSHELRTPLARLFFLVDDAQNASIPQEKENYLRRIEASLQDLNDLVEELLAFVRLEGNAEPPSREAVEVSSVLTEITSLLADLRPELKVVVEGENLKLLAIPHLFRRAVLNLATNAARHARQQVRLACAQEGKVVQVIVDDDGPGVPPEARERIFEPFFRLDESRSADAGGAGLGLAIVQRIAALHRGQVRVEDSPLGGARFILSFPC